MCLCKVCDGCFCFVLIVSHGAVGARVWEVFRHADGVCLCLVCILWQSSRLHYA